MLRYLYLFVVLFNVLLTTSNAQDFIRLETGEKIFGHVEYKKPFLAKPYILLNDSIIYALQDIKSYKNEFGYFSRVEGSLNSNFVERISEGKINLFRESLVYLFPGDAMSVQTPVGTQSYHKPETRINVDFDYFSKGDGDVLKASYDNLFSAMEDNKESITHLKNYNTLAYVRLGIAGTGIAIFIAGLATSTKEKANKSLLVPGVVIAISSWIPYLIGKQEYETAIETYNRP